MADNTQDPTPEGGLSDGFFENLKAPEPVVPKIEEPAANSRRARREAVERIAAVQKPVAADEAVAVAVPDLPPKPRMAPEEVAVTPVAKPVALPPAPAQSAVEALFAAESTPPVFVSAKKKRRRRGCLIWAIILVAVLAVIGTGVAFVWNTYSDKISEMLGWGEPTDWEEGLANGEAMVTIGEGDTGQAISTALFAAGVTRTDSGFYDYLIEEQLNPTFFPGVYTLQKQMTSAAALTALEDPANKQENSASVAEGATLTSILPGIAESMAIPLADLEAAVADPSVYGVAAPSLEGWLFPARYTFDPGVTPQQIIQTMVDRTRQSLTEAGVPAGDEERVLIIASIIQREGRAADFAKVSRVIQNRIDIGMPLQMDSTAQYGFGELEAGSVSTSEGAQRNDNPWNTYVITGLPVTPIASASDAAIDAAMNPVEGPWLYFVTINPESGETVFTESYGDHQQAIKLWGQWCSENGNPESGCSG